MLIWQPEAYRGPKVTTYTVRRKAGDRRWKQPVRVKAQADTFAAELRTAARKGEACIDCQDRATQNHVICTRAAARAGDQCRAYRQRCASHPPGSAARNPDQTERLPAPLCSMLLTFVPSTAIRCTLFLSRDFVVRRDLTGVNGGSLGGGQAGGSEDLLDHRVLPPAVLVDVRSEAPALRLTAAYRSRKPGSARRMSRTARWLRSDGES